MDLELGALMQSDYKTFVFDSFFETLAEAAASGESVALGVITGVKGSSPQRLGAKAVFFANHRIKGTLGGGCLEAEAQRLALESLRDGKPREFELVLDHDFGWDDGLICGGKVTGIIIPNAQLAGEQNWHRLARREARCQWGIRKNFALVFSEGSNFPAGNLADLLYLENVSPPCAFWIAGSGHLAQAIAPLAVKLNFEVSIFDDRPELANHQIFPTAVNLNVGNWGELLSVPFADAPVFGLIVTRGHKHDALVLETWIHRPFKFLGMIGSSRKARTISEHFLRRGIATEGEIAAVECPVGIKIGSKSVMEIAVSIMARYIEKRSLLA